MRLYEPLRRLPQMLMRLLMRGTLHDGVGRWVVVPRLAQGRLSGEIEPADQGACRHGNGAGLNELLLIVTLGKLSRPEEGEWRWSMGYTVNARRKKSDRKEREKKLDQAIETTFPASDPIAMGRPTSTEAQQGRPLSPQARSSASAM